MRDRSANDATNNEVKEVKVEETIKNESVPAEVKPAEAVTTDATTTTVTTVTPVTPIVNQEKKEDNSDVFVTEKDTFDISVLYYKVGNDLCVESVDEDFDYKLPVVKHIDMTFKYPCQGDYETIIAQNAYKSPDKMTLIDVMQMELTRLVVLIRKWSLDAEFTRMVELDTKIVKAIANKVREKIGVKGIL